MGSVLRVRRAHVVASLGRAGVSNAQAVASGMYRSLALGVVELLAMALRPERALAGVRIDRRAIELLDSGRGVVVATAHTGNWDLAACAAARRVPLSVITKELHVRWLNALWQRLRARRGVRLLAAGSASSTALSALGRGEAIAMLVDQAPERARGVTLVPFLGAEAEVDLAPALIAMRARAPLAAVFARRLPDGTHVAELAGVLEPPEHPSRAWAVQATRTVTQWLEAFVRRHPEQWLWMHRRWKRTSAGVVASAAAWTASPGETPRASPTAASP